MGWVLKTQPLARAVLTPRRIHGRKEFGMLPYSVILRPAVGRRISRNLSLGITLSRLFGENLV